MKKLLMILMCMALLCAGALAETNDAGQTPGSELGMQLLNALYVPGENRVISPLSLAQALGMAAEGAQGETLEALLSALGAAETGEISAELPEGVSSANALFVKPELELKSETLDRLKENYGAQQFELDADVVEKVNDWVEAHTDGLIEDMLSEAPNPQIGMILLNAVAMDAQWAHPFDSAANTTEDFHTVGGETVQAEMMHQTEYFAYAEEGGAQAVCLPYAQGDLEMWILMPEAGEMAQLTKWLAEENGLDALRSAAEEKEVALSLPKFDIADENSLSEALKALGLAQAFGADADFSGMSDAPLCLDEIWQKARVQLDEDGTKAAAATAVSVRCMALQNPELPVEMNVDRPFAFLIADAQSGAVCFAGVVENPANL